MTDTKIDDGGTASAKTLRQEYAGRAMQGLLAAGGWAGDEGEGLLCSRSRRAANSVAEADALIAALKEPKP